MSAGNERVLSSLPLCSIAGRGNPWIPGVALGALGRRAHSILVDEVPLCVGRRWRRRAGASRDP
eukprot:1420414-Pleurochrysis_carterae.AAC.4